MAEQMMMTMDDGSEDEESVHSALSNASDFEEDDEVEYLAMEVVNHLPADKASKLLKNMRSKETAVQDLIYRNRSLLDSMRKLDDENQALADRLKDAESAAEEAVKAAAAAPPPPKAAEKAPAASVDDSVFLKLERGKEEKILRLQKENERLVMYVRRMEQSSQQMEEALVQARKEMKKLQQGRAAPAPQRAPEPVVVDASLLDEEERIYRELQGKSGSDAIMQKMEQRQAENKKRIQSALQALLSEDLSRIERWGSDVAAVLMAVDGLEALVKPGSKHKGEAKKGKAAAAAAPGGKAAPLSSDQVQEVSAELLDDYDAVKGKLEVVEKAQLSLEQTARGAFDGADATVAAMELEGPIAQAEQEVEWIREHNATWVKRAQALNLEPTAAMLKSTEAALRVMLENAPPGVIPGKVEDTLRETASQIAELSAKLDLDSKEMAGLQEESVNVGRHVKSLQAAHRTHCAELRRKVVEELQRSASAFDVPLEQMRGGLRPANEALSHARASVSRKLEELAAKAHASAISQGGGGDAHSATNAAGDSEAVLQGLREIRSMGKGMVANFAEGGKALEARMEMVFTALVGEEGQKPPAGGLQGRQTSGGGAAAAVAPAATASPEGKKKKGKKKGPQAPAATPEKADAPVATSGDAKSEAAPSAAAPAKADARKGGDEDAELRNEFREAFEDEPTPKAAGGGGDRKEKKKVLTGNELLEELKALRNDAEALEARMERRAKARSTESLGDAEGEDEGEAKPVAAAKPKRKKMFC